MSNPAQTALHRAAVVIPTLLRPSLSRAVQSVFDQKIEGSIQILIGVDAPDGDPNILRELVLHCPDHIRIDVLDPGYPTSVWRGGIYPARAGGALRSALSFLAHSRLVAYLDDDNWWSPDHLATLVTAVDGVDWAYSNRWFVEAETQEPICVDDWESVGPGAGLYGDMGGFVDTSSLMLDKLKCFDALAYWCGAAYENGTGEDRLVFNVLRERPHRATEQATSYYIARPDDAMNTVRHQQFRDRGIMLPSQRRDRVTTLADAVAGHKSFTTAPKTAARLSLEDPLLPALVEQLKPREILSLANGRSRLGVDIANIAAALGLTPIVAIAEPPSGLVSEADSMRSETGGTRIFVLREPGLQSLGAVRLALDLIHTGDTALPALGELLVTSWPLLRPGGVILGEGHAAKGTALNGVLESFAARANGELLPATMNGVHRWVLQKG